MLNALSVNLEDWYQDSALADVIPRHRWERFPSRLEANTFRLLALLHEAQTKATFFVLGWSAERYPRLILEIERSGHELAIHGYQHLPVREQTPLQFAWEMSRCQEVVQQITGKRSRGFRAPVLSAVVEAPWALYTLLENGIEYESSAFPADGGFHCRPHWVTIDGKGMLVEFPISAPGPWQRKRAVSAPRRLPLLPYGIVRRTVKRANAAGQPALVCMHPWELDGELPPARLLAGRWPPFGNAARRESRLADLLREFQFGTVAQVLDVNLHLLPCVSLGNYANRN